MWPPEMVEKAREIAEELILLDPHPDSTNNHSFTSLTYVDVIAERISVYIDHKGEYE
jgi:hypothetical protein